MQIISGTSTFQINKPTAVAIGKFDGIHLGHMMLIDHIKKAASDKGLQSVIFTFNPSPESFIFGRSMPELTTVNEKRAIFEKLGIDILIEFPMNHETAATDPTLFIERYLHEQMKAAYIVAGHDVSFGDRGKGNAALLMKYSDICGYECDIVDKVTYDGIDISSTRIREAVENGDMELASKLLGKPYSIAGAVSHGKKLGRKIGMPTANVYVAPDKITGPNGVYFSRVITDDGVYNSVSNVGVKPTVSDDELLCIESYLLDFDGDMYGKYIEVELLKFSRPEMKFSGIDELKAQMESDIAAGKIYHNENFRN